MESESSFDPINYLPVELLEKLLFPIPFPEILNLKLVSRKWNKFISHYLETNSAAFRQLDFRDYDVSKLTAEYLVSCIRKSKGTVTQIAVTRRNPLLKQTSILDFLPDNYGSLSSILRSFIILRHRPSPYVWTNIYSQIMNESGLWQPDPDQLVDVVGSSLTNLTSLSLDIGLRAVLSDSRSFRQPTISTLANLQYLEIDLLCFNSLFYFIISDPVRIWFPNLQTFKALRMYDHVAGTITVSPFPGGLTLITNNLVAFPSLKELVFDACFNTNSENKSSAVLDQQCLDMVLNWTPNLESLVCRGFEILGMGSYNYLYRRINLSKTTRLKSADFTLSTTVALPFLPASLRTLILARTYISKMPYVYESDMLTFEGSDDLTGIELIPINQHRKTISSAALASADSVPGSPSVQMLIESIENPTDDDMPSIDFIGLEHLDLSGTGSRLTGDILIAIISIYHAFNLKSIVLSDQNSLFGTGYRNHISQLASICPDLQSVSLDENPNVTKDTLYELQNLQKLSNLSLKNTGVSRSQAVDFCHSHTSCSIQFSIDSE
ncbi:hypothetical protein V1511DRAFT_492266 [Dipodascopsis uninucleata]